MIKKEFSDQSGISLVEVLVVLVIISILIVAAMAQFGAADASFQTQNVARELKVNFERARFDSVKRRPSTIANMARVIINDANSFSITIDTDQNNTLETTDTRTVNFSDKSDARIIANGMALPVTVAFDRKGHITAVDNNGNTVTPTFIICDNCTSSTVSTSDSYLLSISPTGTVTMLRNGETLPSHSNPTTTDVVDDYEIDTMVTVDHTTVPNGTPVPTPTPDPTPNPTPTPTPDYCVSHERPSETGCTCQAPMQIDHHGRCK